MKFNLVRPNQDGPVAICRLLACGVVFSSATLEIFTQRYSADPAPLVVGDRVYMYTSHDNNNQDGWYMTDYNCFSSDDLVNWRDEGIVCESAIIRCCSITAFFF